MRLTGGQEQCAADMDANHRGTLDEMPGYVYVLHYDIPQVVKSVSFDYAGSHPKRDEKDGRFVSATPIRHYVGWTQQDKASRRILAHGPAAMREVVYLEPGTMADEAAMKRSGTCPKCGEALADSLAGSRP